MRLLPKNRELQVLLASTEMKAPEHTILSFGNQRHVLDFGRGGSIFHADEIKGGRLARYP